MTSKLIVNSLAADTGVSTITFADQAKMGDSLFHSTGFTIGDSFLHSTGVNLTNINATGVITATKFVGEVSVGSSITFEDNEKAYFGTGTDFSIYHDGSASYLDESGTGGLIVKTNTAFQVFNSAGSQPAFTVTPGGGIDLYHNTTKMLETTAIGLTINGDVKIIDGENLRLGTGNDMLLYHTGSHSYIENSTGNMYIRGGGGQILMRANSAEDAVVIKPDGAVELYHNNVKKMETTSSGADFTLSSSGQVNLYGLGGTNGLRISGPQSASSAFLFFNTNHQNVSGGTDQYTIQCGGANHTLMFKHGNSTGNVVFELDDIEHVRIPQDGKALKIGAGQDLQLSHNATDSYVSNNTGHLRIGNTHDSSNIKFFTNNSTRWNIDSNGHFIPDSNNTFNIGSASYTIGDLFLSGNITSSGNFNTTSSAPLQFTNNSNTTSAKKTVIYANFNNTSNHVYNGLLVEMGHVTDSLSGEVRKFTIGERGGHTNVIFDQNGVHFGGGSTNPTLGTSTGLDDYEEGSYVVSVTGSNSGSFALNPNSFRYTKIGRTVHVSGRFYVVSGSPTGTETRVSLPFTSAPDIQSQDGRAFSYVATWNAYTPNNDYSMAFSVLPNSGYGVLLWIVPGGHWQTVSPSSHMNQRNAYYGFDFTYTTAT